MPTSRSRRLAVSVLIAILTILALTPGIAVAAGGIGFVGMANEYRADARLGPVAYHSVINAIAVERGRQIADDRALGHDFDYLRRRFAEEGICWRGFGEIVAWNGSGDVSAFGTQWFNSTTHRNVMRGDYTHASGSRISAGGQWYGVMVFVKICNAPPSAPTTSGFTDLGTSQFIDDIEWLVEQEITSGCAALRFCPRSSVSRGAMATFLERAFDVPEASADYFTDDERSTHEPAINSIRQANFTGGCARVRYCPDTSVSRGQAATFLDRALNLPDTDEDFFTDDDGSVHEGAINRIAAAGITTGCGSGHFCPRMKVSREQMAAFLRRALT